MKTLAVKRSESEEKDKKRALWLLAKSVYNK
jgi:hypothetical protein